MIYEFVFIYICSIYLSQPCFYCVTVETIP